MNVWVACWIAFLTLLHWAVKVIVLCCMQCYISCVYGVVVLIFLVSCLWRPNPCSCIVSFGECASGLRLTRKSGETF